VSEIKCKVTVKRPVLTEQERERRMKEIKKAVVAIAIELDERKARENG
jgi:hypothetical protein